MRHCTGCGFPRRFAKFLEWRSDGSIAGTVRPRIPLMFLEVDEWDTLYDELAMTIGAPIEHIVIEAQKYIGKDLYDMVKAVYWNIDARKFPNNKWIRPQWLARGIVSFMSNDIAGLGAGRSSIESYRAGDHLDIRIKNPCVIPMTLGSCQGIYESVEKMPGSRVGYSFKDGDLRVHLEHSDEERDASEDRLFLEEAIAGRGPLFYDRCVKCGTPLLVSEKLQWDVGAGIILNPRTGKREDMMAVQSINAIFRELERELGEEVIDILYRAQKWYSNLQLRDVEVAGVEDFWKDYLLDMALRGLGYPTDFESTSTSVAARISNAYNQDLYAARLAAGLEKVTGRPSEIEWQARDRHYSLYRITTPGERAASSEV